MKCQPNEREAAGGSLCRMNTVKFLTCIQTGNGESPSDKELSLYPVRSYRRMHNIHTRTMPGFRALRFFSSHYRDKEPKVMCQRCDPYATKYIEI